MNPEQITIKPNQPVTLALADPLGDSANFDFELRVGRFTTTDGRVLVLPETATIAMNEVSPQAGESIEITRIWSGRSCDRERWRILLSSEAQEARQVAGGPGGAGGTKEETGEPPEPISRPVLRKMPRPEQPPLFENYLGTGTDGPRPRPAIVKQRTPPEVIPVNVAVREILQFIDQDPNTRNWSDKARQGAASTILIAEYRAKRIGLWEREK